jgi:hypothetical protein
MAARKSKKTSVKSGTKTKAKRKSPAKKSAAKRKSPAKAGGAVLGFRVDAKAGKIHQQTIVGKRAKGVLPTLAAARKTLITDAKKSFKQQITGLKKLKPIVD